MRYIFPLVLLATTCSAQQADYAPIKRRLPPVGDALKDADREKLNHRIAELNESLQSIKDSGHYPDAAVLVKSVRFAIDHDEFYKPGDIKKATAILDLASQRIKQLGSNNAPWTTSRGPVVLGYQSSIDDSLQPFGMEIPEEIDLTKPVPLYVWLHGRGDTATDMHFVDQRLNRAGKIKVDDGLIVHPFGRQCVGFKHAGEIDVLDVIEEVAGRYSIDRDRIVLIGFSMGGAGAWHVGAHYTDRFVAVCPGAGFAETRRYQNITPDKYPAKWEQTLWQVYDVPRFVRNLFNTRVIAYSGENDKQIQAARVMEEAFQSEGQQLDHRIGPGMGHKYHPDTLAKIMHDLKQATQKRVDPMSPVHLQTTTLRYNRMRWISISELKQHYRDTRVNAKHSDDGWDITTSNVTGMTIVPPGDASSVQIDGQSINIVPNSASHVRRADSGKWAVSPDRVSAIRKSPGLQGPIDDVFMRPFLVVLPTGNAYHSTTERWVNFESRHFVDRWKALMRGTPRVKTDKEVTLQDIENYNLVLWGDPSSNGMFKKVLSTDAGFTLPLQWNAKTFSIAGQTANLESHVPVMIYPNPLNPQRYVAINAGLTFREEQDRTNSLQNPRLPDWAIVGMDQPPTGAEPGRIVAAGFFGESW